MGGERVSLGVMHCGGVDSWMLDLLVSSLIVLGNFLVIGAHVRLLSTCVGSCCESSEAALVIETEAVHVSPIISSVAVAWRAP